MLGKTSRIMYGIDMLSRISILLLAHSRSEGNNLDVPGEERIEHSKAITGGVLELSPWRQIGCLIRMFTQTDSILVKRMKTPPVMAFEWSMSSF